MAASDEGRKGPGKTLQARRPALRDCAFEEFDGAFVGVDCAGQLAAVDGEVALVEGGVAAGLRRGLDCELVAFHGAGDRHRVGFAGADPAGYGTAVLLEEGFAGDLAVGGGDGDVVGAGDVGGVEGEGEEQGYREKARHGCSVEQWEGARKSVVEGKRV